jgi:hypothetical protein
MWPVEHGLARPVRPDSSWPLTRVDPTAENPRVECIKLSTSLLNPTSPAPAPHSAPQSPSTHVTLHRLHSPPHRTASSLPTASRRHSTPHRVAPSLPTASRPHSTPYRAAPLLHHLHSPPCRAATPPSPLPNGPDSSWPVLEDPSMTIFDAVALFLMTTMVMVVPTCNRLQPVR